MAAGACARHTRGRVSPYSSDMGNAGRRRHVLAVLGLVVGLAAVALGVRATEVHAYGWEWTLSPSAAPPRIEFEGRGYDRGGLQSGGVPDDAVLEGETLGGGQIFKPGRDTGTSTIVFVKDGPRVYVYGLMGGP